jgi:hypothetical protein
MEQFWPTEAFNNLSAFRTFRFGRRLATGPEFPIASEPKQQEPATQQNRRGVSLARKTIDPATTREGRRGLYNLPVKRVSPAVPLAFHWGEKPSFFVCTGVGVVELGRWGKVCGCQADTELSVSKSRRRIPASCPFLRSRTRQLRPGSSSLVVGCFVIGCLPHP